MATDDINFYEEDAPHGYCSNFWPAPFVIDGKEWASSEHYFQAQKFAGTPREEQVRLAATPDVAKTMGGDRSSPHPMRSDWESVKDAVMQTACLAKFRANADLARQLLATGDARIVEHTKNDRYWGDGGDGTGRNQLGIVLMAVRDQLRKDAAAAAAAASTSASATS